jgi:hypothetical protein
MQGVLPTREDEQHFQHPVGSFVVLCARFQWMDDVPRRAGRRQRGRRNRTVNHVPCLLSVSREVHRSICLGCSTVISASPREVDCHALSELLLNIHLNSTCVLLLAVICTCAAGTVSKARAIPLHVGLLLARATARGWQQRCNSSKESPLSRSLGSTSSSKRRLTPKDS